MFKINDDLSIYVTRGDAVVFNLNATTDNGETYIFKPEDVVRIKIMERKGCEDVVFQKVFVIEEETDTVEISLSGEDTTIGDVISKPTDYWYEVELNPFTIPQTIIGYDDEAGAKIFKLFPEGNSELKPKDVPVVDRELDLYSDRPIQNQAVAWAVTNAINEMHITTEKAVEDTVEITNNAIAEVNTITENAVNEFNEIREDTINTVNASNENTLNEISGIIDEVHTSNENTLNEVNALVGEVRKELQNVPNADNMANLQSQITDNKNQINEHLAATDPHNIEDGLINKEVAEDVATNDKVLVVVDGEILKTNVDNIGVREIEAITTITAPSTFLADEWQAMTGLETKAYYGVAYGDGKYVCVATGKACYSTDGLTWQAMTGLDEDGQYLAVTYGNGRFVCVGAVGASSYSTDGLTWTSMTGLDTSKTYRGVTYGDGKFVCVGTSGYSYYSTDGVTWQAMTGLDTSKTYYGVAYGDGRFVCVGLSGYSFYSTDGLTWKAMSGLPSNQHNSVTYGNGRFVCVSNSSNASYSTDGVTWTAMTGLTSANLGVTFGDGKFVCVGVSGKSYYSLDGETWVAMTGLDTSTTYQAVTYGTDFVCVGQSGASAHYVYETETNTETLQGSLQVAGTLLLTKLYTGQTTVTIEDASITQDSTFEFYTDKFGVGVKNVTVDTGKITLEFRKQNRDLLIKVVVK